MTTLAELRQANLKEQNTPQPEKPAPVAAAPVTASALPLDDAPIVPAPPPADPSPALRLSVADAALSEDAQRDVLFLARIREAMSHKTIHPTGAKATVDMAPALFHRAKRYCNAHGNLSLRQVFLELLTLYLEEEGY